jgi:hypothetical protein
VRTRRALFPRAKLLTGPLRAQAAHLALENYGSALADAENSVQLDASYIKG